ncbi:hypothetical protein [Flavobacterium capsici]|uniref:Uncharacterized protein n=1 Tax=Flavobacterium capsici TaxID=3075618 RepID=A0AA96J3Q3_9FLAO|nr:MULTISPECIES: hypothetical protein [unclassified Flavobacterium]WNM19618.1 hypothetical protein RN608_02785 [Flavobacterium sp. PMR2A8]WNM21007.1 hypothetical protein RN605_09955 [Flavobacterium sp. PMTSA4]
MKAISMILLTIFLGKGCNNEAQNDISKAVLQYDAHTRGYHLKVIISNQIATVSEGRTPDNPSEQMKISDSDWKELIGYFEKINLEELPNLKDPSQKRFYDGAAIAELKVRYQDTNYETKAFDHKNPPTEIKQLVDKIVSMVKKPE